MTAEPAPPPRHSRTVIALSIGARICLIIGAVLLAFAGYLFWGPLGHSVANGFPARCGSAAKPPHDSLGKAVCGTVNSVRRAQAITVLITAVVVSGGGLAAFGVRRAPSHRGTREWTREQDANEP